MNADPLKDPTPQVHYTLDAELNGDSIQAITLTFNEFDQLKSRLRELRGCTMMQAA